MAIEIHNGKIRYDGYDIATLDNVSVPSSVLDDFATAIDEIGQIEKAVSSMTEARDFLFISCCMVGFVTLSILALYGLTALFASNNIPVSCGGIINA